MPKSETASKAEKPKAPAKPKAPQVRIDALRGKQFSLPHAGNPGEGRPFVVGEDGMVQVMNDERELVALTQDQADSIVRLRHLDGAVLVG